MKSLATLSVLLLAVLCLVQCQSPTISTSKATSIAPTKSTAAKTTMTPTKASVTPTKSSSKVPVKPTLVPTPTPLPAGVDSYTYVIPHFSNASIPCLKMVVDVALNFTFVNSSNVERSTWIRFQNTSASLGVLTVDPSKTNCSVGNKSSTNPSANLTLKYVLKESVETFFVTFSFVGDLTSGNQHWSSNNLSVDFDYQSKLFPDNKDKLSGGDKSLYTNTSLFDETNQRVEFTRPYRCFSNQTIEGFNVLGANTTVGLWIRELEVQAFKFLDSSGNFSTGNAPRVCLLDNTTGGNEVVPIAVGVALAVLVVAVLIAYLIGRFRSKKKSSYEALK